MRLLCRVSGTRPRWLYSLIERASHRCGIIPAFACFSPLLTQAAKELFFLLLQQRFLLCPKCLQRFPLWIFTDLKYLLPFQVRFPLPTITAPPASRRMGPFLSFFFRKQIVDGRVSPTQYGLGQADKDKFPGWVARSRGPVSWEEAVVQVLQVMTRSHAHSRHPRVPAHVGVSEPGTRAQPATENYSRASVCVVGSSCRPPPHRGLAETPEQQQVRRVAGSQGTERKQQMSSSHLTSLLFPDIAQIKI